MSTPAIQGITTVTEPVPDQPPSLFDRFIDAGLYLKGWSPKTARTYHCAFVCFQKSGQPLSKTGLELWVRWMREKGLTSGAVNVYIRSVNSLLTWLEEEEGRRIPKLKLLKTEQKVLQTFSESQIKAMLSYRPQTFQQLRNWALVQAMLDTGARVEELLTLRSGALDFDNLLITLFGKGRKERKIPFSIELRKVLWRLIQTKTKQGIPGNMVFCVRSGGRLSYRNVVRDLQVFCAALKITGPRISPHTFRHTFATNYLRRGGDIYRLCRVLGHTDIRTTMRYLHLVPDDLREQHQRSSLLSRIGV